MDGSLTAESPEVVRLSAAALELDEAEGSLVSDLLGSSPNEAAALADRVAAARREFDAALTAVQVAL